MSLDKSDGRNAIWRTSRCRNQKWGLVPCHSQSKSRRPDSIDHSCGPYSTPRPVTLICTGLAAAGILNLRSSNEGPPSNRTDAEIQSVIGHSSRIVSATASSKTSNKSWHSIDITLKRKGELLVKDTERVAGRRPFALTNRRALGRIQSSVGNSWRNATSRRSARKTTSGSFQERSTNSARTTYETNSARRFAV